MPPFLSDQLRILLMFTQVKSQPNKRANIFSKILLDCKSLLLFWYRQSQRLWETSVGPQCTKIRTHQTILPSTKEHMSVSAHPVVLCILNPQGTWSTPSGSQEVSWASRFRNNEEVGTAAKFKWVQRWTEESMWCWAASDEDNCDKGGNIPQSQNETKA